MAFWIVRIVAVIALLGVAAAIATPKGRLPLAMRGLSRLLGRSARRDSCERVSAWKRLVAFVLVIVAVMVCVL